MTTPKTPPTRPSRRETTNALAKRLAHKNANGERAALRRLSYRSPDAPAFWKIAVTDLDSLLARKDPKRSEDVRKWAALLSGLAQLAGSNLHVPKAHLGKAMGKAEIHEMRVTKLLRARGDALLDLLGPLAQQIASKAIPVDWGDVVELVFSQGFEHEDKIRQRIASDYYHIIYKKAEKAS